MTLRSGTYHFGPRDGRLLLRTGREGRAARLGHDLVLEATRWSATAVVHTRAIEQCELRASVDARSLVVRDAAGGPVPLTAGQRDDIAAIIRRDVLHADEHRDVTFQSTAVTGTSTAVVVRGDLTVAGVTRRASIDVATSGERITAALTVRQSRHGIAQYSAMLGALRVKDDVAVTVDVAVPSTS